MAIFGFWVYLGHFKGLGIFLSLYRFQGYSGHFLGLGGVFWSFLGFRIIFVNF